MIGDNTARYMVNDAMRRGLSGILRWMRPASALDVRRHVDGILCRTR